MTQPYTSADIRRVARVLAGDDWRDAIDDAAAVLSALAAAGRLTPAGGQPDVWEYGRPDPDEPDGLMTFDGTPRVITPRMVRRPMRAVGPWLPVPEEER